MEDLDEYLIHLLHKGRHLRPTAFSHLSGHKKRTIIQATLLYA